MSPFASHHTQLTALCIRNQQPFSVEDPTLTLPKGSSTKWPGLKTSGSPHFSVGAPLQPQSHWGSELFKLKPQTQTASHCFQIRICLFNKKDGKSCLLFSLPVKYTTCILQFPKVLACSVWPPLINTQRSKEVSGRGLHTNLVPLEETEYLLHSCVIWQALHPDQGSRLGQDGSVGGSGSSCHSSWGSCNVPHRGRRYWRAERERERKQNCYKNQ